MASSNNMCFACVKNFAYKNVILAVLLGSITFLAYTHSISDWHLGGDSKSVFHNARIRSMKDFCDLFTSRSNSQCALPSNMKYEKQTFFGSTYRPLVGLWNSWQVALFGWSGQHQIFLFSIFLFALCVASLFYTLSCLGNIWLAAAGSMFFAFHSANGIMLGELSFQVFYVGLLALLVSILWLKKFLDGRGCLNLFGSVILFALALWSHEIFIVYPVWLIAAVPAYFYMRSGCVSWRRFAVSVMPFISVLALYFIVRAITYPIDFTDPGIIILSPFCAFKRAFVLFRYLDFVPMIFEMLGFRWLSLGHPVARSAILLATAVPLGYCVFFSTKRLSANVLLFGAFLFHWPSFVMTLQSYYAFIPLAFFIAAVVVGLSETTFLKYGVIVGFLALSVPGFAYNRLCMRVNSSVNKQVSAAIDRFVEEYKTDLRPVMFVGVPHHLFCPSGVAQQIWLLRGDDSAPVYVDFCLNTVDFTSDDYIKNVDFKNFSNLSISRSGRSIRMISNDRNGLGFAGGLMKKCSIGKRHVNEFEIVNYDTRVYDVTVDIDEKWWSDDLRLMTWDSVKQKVVPLF